MPSETLFSPRTHLVAYLRDSGGTEQDLSITQQKESLQNWAQEHQVIITQFYIDEARSGSSTVGRKAFQQMIDHFRQPLVPESGLILWSFSRFARDINDALYFKADLRRRGFTVRAIQDSVPDGLDGVIFESLLDWKNAKFRVDLAADTKRGLSHNLREYGAIGGRPPRGFRRESKDIGKRRDGSTHIIASWVPDPDTWEVCKLAWQMRAEGKTYRQINKTTHLFGSINSYSTFFSNRLYIGEMDFGDTIVPDYVQPMIDLATWEKVQFLRRPENNPFNTFKHPRRVGSSFLLSGLVFCSRCGAPLNGIVVKFSERYEYHYYKCSASGRSEDCNALQIPQEPLELAVITKMTDYILSPDKVFERQKELLDVESEKASALNDRKKALNGKMKQLEREIKNLLDVIKESGSKSVRMAEEVDQLERDQVDCKDQLMQLLNEQIFQESVISPEEARSRAEAALAKIDSEDKDDLKTSLRGLVNSIYAEKDGHFVRGMINFYGPPGADLPGQNDDSTDRDFMRKGGVPPGAPNVNKLLCTDSCNSNGYLVY